MRALIAVLLCLLLFVATAEAKVYTVKFGTVAATATATTSAINVIRSSMVSFVWFFTSAQTTGTVTMSLEGSIDGTNWAPYGTAYTQTPNAGSLLVPRQVILTSYGAAVSPNYPGVPAPLIRLKLTNTSTGANLTNVAAAVMTNGD